MPESDTTGSPEELAALRQKIDSIDSQVHHLLIERASVVESLIKTKGTSNPANAFRPGREADMMRRFVAAHSGGLPITTIEHIWREIITTFTRLQAPFDIVIDSPAGQSQDLRDLVRFYFGFQVAVHEVADAGSVVESVQQSANLGIIPLAGSGGRAAWWRSLVGDETPTIMMILPFIRTEGRPVATPALVISPPLADPTPPDVTLFAVRAQSEPVSGSRLEVLSVNRDGAGWDALVATKAGTVPSGEGFQSIELIGGIARGIALDGLSTVLYAAV